MGQPNAEEGLRRAEWLVQAIYDGVNAGAKILNVSLGGYFESFELDEALGYAAASDVLVVGAAGNDGRRALGPDPIYPANDARSLAVNALARQGTLASHAAEADWIKLAAPGGEDPPREQPNYRDGQIRGLVPGGYGYKKGTSYASAHVAGVAALMRAANPTLTRADLIEFLQSTADPLGAQPLPNRAYGWGRVNAGRAVRAARDGGL